MLRLQLSVVVGRARVTCALQLGCRKSVDGYYTDVVCEIIQIDGHVRLAICKLDCCVAKHVRVCTSECVELFASVFNTVPGDLVFVCISGCATLHTGAVDLFMP